MVVLGRVEGFAKHNLGATPRSSAFLLDPTLCQGKLRLIVAEDRGAILRRACSRRHVARPELIEERFVGDEAWVVDQVHSFRVVRQVVIGGRCRRSSRVPNLRVENTVETPKPGVGAPESAKCKGEALGSGGILGIDWYGHRHNVITKLKRARCWAR